MTLTAYDKQQALDYIIYMMMGSFFKGTQTEFRQKEKILRMRYLLLGTKTQYELEERCEKYFVSRIQPELPEGFLDGRAEVRWAETPDRQYTEVIFTREGRSLTVTSLYGGRFRDPIFRFRVA